MMKTNELLLAITRCPEVPKARADANHPCHGIVCSQQADAFQAPEPWRGHIDTAPILFVASNPSIGGKYQFPPLEWHDSKIVHHSQCNFDPNAGYVSVSSSGAQRVIGGDGKWVRYWSGVRKHAGDILGQKPKPGMDYALTEMVHCKSSGERGVSDALYHCTNKWMLSIMEISGAVVVVLLGKHAQNAATKIWKLDTAQKVHFDVHIAGRNRAVVLLPHTNSRGKRKIKDYVSHVQLERLRALLRDH